MKRLIGAALCATLSLVTTGHALAQTDAYPNRPIKLIVGFAPGGSSDTVARIMVPRLSELLKQSVVVDNKPGAGGNIASDALIKAPADGYTIMLGTIGSLAVNQHLAKLAYNPVTDMTALSLAVVFTNVLVVNANSSIRNFDDYLRQSKATASNVAFGSSGVGGSGHLAGELINVAAGLKNQHIAYRGGAPAMNDLLGGVLPSIFSSPTDALQHIQAGKLRALATTGAKRDPALPELPTIAESGVAGYESGVWFGLAVAAGTPREVIAKLNDAANRSTKAPEFIKRITDLGYNIMGGSPEQMSDLLKIEVARWGPIVKASGAKAD